MPRVYKLSIGQLKKIIAEEKAAHIVDVEKHAKKTKEVEADEYADTLEKEIDHAKAMKIKEAKLVSELKKVRETLRKLDEVIPRGSSTKAVKRSGRPNVGAGKAPAYVHKDAEEEFFGEKLPTSDKKKTK